MKAGCQIQAQRDREDIQRHQERVEWLSGESPVWACGTPMGEYDRRTLLLQSRNELNRLLGESV